MAYSIGRSEEATRFLNRRLEKLREQLVYGQRQDRTFREASTKYLNEHQHKRSLEHDAHTGTREQEVAQLRWDWEVKLPELNRSVFVIPASIVKNKTDRVVILNDAAQSVIEAMRGQHGTHVFTYDGHALTGINSSGWKAARRRAAVRYQEVIGGPCPQGFRCIRDTI